MNFIGVFESQIHKNPRFSLLQKQMAITQLLVGKAKQHSITNGHSKENYYLIRTNLHTTYNCGRFQKDYLTRKVRMMTFKANSTIEEIEESLATYAGDVRRLKGLGLYVDDYKYLQEFTDALPKKIRKRVEAYNMSGNRTFELLITCTQAVIAQLKAQENREEMEEKVVEKSVKPARVKNVSAMRSYNNENDVEQDSDESEERYVDVQAMQHHRQQDRKQFNGDARKKFGYKKKEFVPPSKQIPCAYCNSEQHGANNCTKDTEFKKSAVSKNKLCDNCLSAKHFARDCKSKYNCYHCRGTHYSGHCDRVKSATVNVFNTKFDLEDDEELEQQLFQC